MFAIVEIAGQQFKVAKDQKVFVHRLATEEGKKVAFDIEDWYSHDLLPEARASRPLALLRKLEKKALCNGVFSITTSESATVNLTSSKSGRPNQGRTWLEYA